MKCVKILLSVIVIMCLVRGSSGKKIQKSENDNHFKSKLIAADEHDELLFIIYFISKHNGDGYDQYIERVASSHRNTVIIKVDVTICKTAANDFGVVDNEGELFPKFILRKSGVNLYRLDGFTQNELRDKIELYEDVVDEQGCSGKKIQKAENDNHFKSKLIAADKHEELLFIIYFISKHNGDGYDQYIERVASSHPNTVIVKVDVTICKTTAKDFGVVDKEEELFPKFIFRKSGVNLWRFDGFTKKELNDKIELYEDHVNEQGRSVKTIQMALSDRDFESKLIAVDKLDALVVIFFFYENHGEDLNEIVEEATVNYPALVIIKVDASICRKTAYDIAQGGRDYVLYPTFRYRRLGVHLDLSEGLMEKSDLYNKIDMYKDDINKPGIFGKNIQKAVNDNHFKAKLKAADIHDELLFVIYFVSQQNSDENELPGLSHPTPVIIKVDVTICKTAANDFGVVDKEGELFPKFILRKSGVDLYRINGFDVSGLNEKIDLYQDNINIQGCIQTAVSDKHFDSKMRVVDKYDMLVVVFFVYTQRGEDQMDIIKAAAKANPALVIIKVDACVCTKTADDIAQGGRNYVLYPTLVYRRLGVNIDRYEGFINLRYFIERIDLYKDSIDESIKEEKNQEEEPKEEEKIEEKEEVNRET